METSDMERSSESQGLEELWLDAKDLQPIRLLEPLAPDPGPCPGTTSDCLSLSAQTTTTNLKQFVTPVRVKEFQKPQTQKGGNGSDLAKKLNGETVFEVPAHVPLDELPEHARFLIEPKDNSGPEVYFVTGAGDLLRDIPVGINWRRLRKEGTVSTLLGQLQFHGKVVVQHFKCKSKNKHEMFLELGDEQQRVSVGELRFASRQIRRNEDASNS